MENDSDIDHEWFVGANGNWYRDQGGARYCAALIGPGEYETAFNGVVFGRRHPSRNEARAACDADARDRSRRQGQR